MGSSSARRFLFLVVIALSGACGRLDYERSGLMDATDSGPTRDAATPDAGSGALDASSDAGNATADAGPTDAGGATDAGEPVDGGETDAGAVTCPADTFLVEPPTGALFCVERNDRAAAPFATAQSTCVAEGRHLCTDDEWRVGCELGGAAFLDLADDWEWVDLLVDAATAKKRGYTCGDTSSHVVTDPYAYRCCAAL